MKNYIKRLPLITGIALLLMTIGLMPLNVKYVTAQQTGLGPDTRSVSVAGNGQVNAQPDVAVIVVGVQTEAAEASAALSQNSEQLQAVIDAVAASGVLTDDIQTQVVQLQPSLPVPSPDPNQPAPVAGQTAVTPTGYIATNLVEIRVRDITSLGTLLDTAIAAGGNRIESIRFEVSDVNTALEQAREAAWNDARAKAEQLAQLAGATLGEVLLINDYSATPFPSAQAGAVALDSRAAVPIAPGNQLIAVSLQITWRLSE